MARSTPTYTPIRNYAIGILLSVFLLFVDINYGSFSSIRGFIKATTLYVQISSTSLVQNIGYTFSAFQNTKDLLKENQELKEQILKINIKDFIENTNTDKNIKILNLYEGLVGTFESNNINLYKIASIDLRNYLCCSTHRIVLHNPQKIQIKKNLPVLAGESFIGQTANSYIGFIEVILLSDIDHFLPIKSNNFYCDARGKGKPLLISCSLDKEVDVFKNVVGDPVYTSGLGGIFMKDIEIGLISEIKSISVDEIEVIITLKANPLEEIFYGIISDGNDEI